VATDDLLRELIKGQKDFAEKLIEIKEDVAEKLTAQTKAIVAVGQDIKVIKDEVKNLTQRVDVTEKAIHNIENNAITRDKLNEMQRKKAEVIIFNLPESKDGLKGAVMAKLNEVLNGRNQVREKVWQDL
jgi:hypothetical protein